MSVTLLFALAVGIVVLFTIAAAYTFLNPSRTGRDRVSEMTGGPKRGSSQDELADRIAKRLSDLASSKDLEDADLLRKQLIMAGYKDRNAPQLYNAARLVFAILFPIVGSVFLIGASLPKMVFGVLLLVAGGYYMPWLVVVNATNKRQADLMKAYPDAVDLLVTCVESGLGLDAAIKRVALEIEGAAPLLSAELMMVNHEISAGITRNEALKHLAERTGLDEIRSLVNMMIQADRFGTSIANSLRIQSHISREKRIARAEEAAAAVSPKLTVVMMVFLMPTLMGVLLSPAMIQAFAIMGG